MHNLIWKLAALAGVVSVGFLMIFQAQRGLTRADGDNLQAPFEEFADTAEEGGQADHSENKNVTGDVSFDRYEPTTAGDRNGGDFGLAPEINEDDADQGLVGQSEPPQDADLPEQFQTVPLSKTDDFTATPEASISDAAATVRPIPGGLDFRQQANASGKNGSSRSPHPLAEDKENSFANLSDHAGNEDQDTAKANGASSENRTDDVKPNSEPELADNERPTETKNDANPFDDASERLTADPVEREPIQPAQFEETERGNPKLNSGVEPVAPQKTSGTNGPRLMHPGASTASQIGADPSHFEQNSAKKNRSTDQPVEDDPFGSDENPETADQTSEGPLQSADAEKLAPFTPQKDHSNHELERRNPFAPQPKETPQPDPAAFDNISAPGTTEPSNPFDRKMPKQKPAGDDNQTKVPQRPSMGSERPARGEGPKVQSKPFPTTGRETDDNPNLPLDTKQTASSAEIATQQQAVPGRLNPKPKASRLVPPKPENLQGEATVDAEVPRGPQRTRLNIEKTAPKNALLGQPLIYSILIKNLGDSPAHQVVVEDSIPKGTKLNGTIPRAEMTGKKLVWKLGTLEPGEQRKIRLRVIPIKEGQVGSIATVNFISKVAAQTMITAPALSLELTGPPQAKLGEPVTFNFKVTNNGSGDATGVLIRNLIPEQLTHPNGSDLEYEVGTLTAGKSKQFVLSVTAAKIGLMINRATLTADGDFSVEAKTELEILGSSLLVTRIGPKKRPLGRPAVYSNRIVNNSAAAVQGITVVETVPDGIEFVKASHGGQYDGVKRTVAWEIDRLGPKEAQEVQVEFVARRSGTMTSLITVTDGSGSQTNLSSQTTLAGLAALATDVHGVNGPVAVGETVSLQIRVRNRGSDKASNVTLRISVPNELQFLQATGAAKPVQAGRELRFAAVSTLDARNDTVVTIVLKAVRSGEARLKIQVDADHMNQPLVHEEAIAVITAN